MPYNFAAAYAYMSSISSCKSCTKAGHQLFEKHEALLPVQDGVHLRSPLQLNNSGFPPGPINSFHFGGTVVARVLYPQELLWTVRCISTYIHPMGSTSEHMPCGTPAHQNKQAVLLAVLPAVPSSLPALNPPHEWTATEHPSWPAPAPRAH